MVYKICNCIHFLEAEWSEWSHCSNQNGPGQRYVVFNTYKLLHLTKFYQFPANLTNCIHRIRRWLCNDVPQSDCQNRTIRETEDCTSTNLGHLCSSKARKK